MKIGIKLSRNEKTGKGLGSLCYWLPMSTKNIEFCR